MNELHPEDKAFLGPFLPHNARTSSSTSDATYHERPFVTLTFASSLDSMIALAPGMRTTLSGPETKCMTHFLRLHHDAILVGVGTAVVDDPALNCRYPGARLDDQPQPVIVDPNCRWKMQGQKVIQLASDGKGKAPWIFTNESCDQAQALQQVGGTYIVLDRSSNDLTALKASNSPEQPSLAWPLILKALKERGINSVMVEGGAHVINTLLAMPDLVDSVIVTIAPTWLGIGGMQVAPAARSSNGQRVNAAWLRKASWRQFGNDAVLCGSLHHAASNNQSA